LAHRHRLPTDVEAIESRHVEDWIGSILETNKPATAHNRWRGVQRSFSWYATKVDDFLSPMHKLHPPRLPQHRPRVLGVDELRAVLGTCQGSSFADKRDNALIRIFFDTGARRHEIGALRYSSTDPDDRDVDMRRATVRVLGKGDKDNVIGISDKTLSALDDYLRVRRKHDDAALPWLWLGKRGRLTDNGIAQALRSAACAGIDHLHARLPHAATHHEPAAACPSPTPPVSPAYPCARPVVISRRPRSDRVVRLWRIDGSGVPMKSRALTATKMTRMARMMAASRFGIRSRWTVD
jgi:site-specific recombinase XerD